MHTHIYFFAFFFLKNYNTILLSLHLQAVRIFAGVHRSRSGQLTPTGVGRLCNWTPDVDGPPADDYQSFGAYQRTLTLKCDHGEPGVITWTPDRDTPDTVYYQCFTHRYLGWKIHVHDACEDPGFSASASENQELRIPFANVDDAGDVTAEASIRHETKVSPNENFLFKHQTDLIKNHNMNGTPPKFTFEITKSSEITKLISDGIRAAEALEASILKNANGSNHTNQSIVSSEKINRNPDTVPIMSTIPTHQQTNMKTVGSIKTITVEANSKLPLEPHIATAVPEVLYGENHAHSHNKNIQNLSRIKSKKPSSSTSSPYHFLHHQPKHTQSYHHFHNLTNIPAQSPKPIGLSEFLRPPHSTEFLHPVKLPGRRPLLRPIKKVPTAKPVLPQQIQRTPQIPIQPIPQPSIIVSHYRKAAPGLLKGILQENQFPLQSSIASVLLLGQPTTLSGHRKNDPVLSHSIQNSIIPVPYNDTVPRETIELHNSDKREISASIKPVKNNGFKSNSIVIESGFRPIIRAENVLPPLSLDQVAHRREDPGSEINEAMETDTLFLTAQKLAQTQSFEPMFIPSPPDSTNISNYLRNIVSSSSTISENEHVSNISAEIPIAAKLRNATLEDILADLDEVLLEEESTTKLDETATKKIIEGEKLEENFSENLKNQSLSVEDNTYDMEEADEEDEREAQAAERIDTYYLPPDNRKIPHASLPSGAVVTFDGKSIVDGNLVLPPKLETFEGVNSRRQAHGLSQIEQLIRSTPQVRPFRGEIPQPVAEFISNERSRNRVSGSRGGGIVGGTGSGNAGPYLPLTSLSPPRVHSTKLQLLQSAMYRQ